MRSIFFKRADDTKLNFTSPIFEFTSPNSKLYFNNLLMNLVSPTINITAKDNFKLGDVNITADDVINLNASRVICNSSFNANSYNFLIPTTVSISKYSSIKTTSITNAQVMNIGVIPLNTKTNIINIGDTFCNINILGTLLLNNQNLRSQLDTFLNFDSLTLSANSIASTLEPSITKSKDLLGVQNLLFNIPKGTDGITPTFTISPAKQGTLPAVVLTKANNNNYDFEFTFPKGDKGEKPTFGNNTAIQIASTLQPTISVLPTTGFDFAINL